MTSPLADISGDFVDTCTIQVATESQNACGEITHSWTDLPGHINISCVVTEGDGSVKGEVVRDNMTVTFYPLKVTLFGPFPDIRSTHRAVIDGVAYNIVDTYVDALGYSTTLQVVSVC